MIGVSSVGNATLIVHDEVPLLTTDPWLGETDPAYFGSWVLSHEIPKTQILANVNANVYKLSQCPLVFSVTLILQNCMDKKPKCSHNFFFPNGVDLQILKNITVYIDCLARYV